jgi:iron-sulfur cluster repair protein YtfE (RIC family)
VAITKDWLIEDLIREFPQAVKILREKKIRCIACGEPIWGTIAEAAQEKQFSEKQIADLIVELNLKLNG